MILAIDIGNSSVVFGVYTRGGELKFRSKLSTVKNKCEDEYAVMIRSIFDIYRFPASEIDGGIISSVVPPLTEIIARAVNKLFAITPIIVGPGVKTGLNIKVDIHTQLGSDLVADAVAATKRFPAPLVICDLGTATSLVIINERSELVGVVIAPGARVSLDALSATAAELPYISLSPPKSIIAKNTSDSMTCGVVYGHAAMLDGLISKIAADLHSPSLTTVATGGLADSILPFCTQKITPLPTLTLDGLFLIYMKNSK